MMIEDILIRVSGDRSLATRFIGGASPFIDLQADLPYYNAVMLATSRGIMEAKDKALRTFAPLSPVDRRGSPARDPQDQGRIATISKNIERMHG